MAVPGVIERARGALLGAFTGDTEMMIVLAEHLARHDGVDAPALAEAVLSRHDPQRGYGSRWWPRAVKVTPLAVTARRRSAGRAQVPGGCAE